MHEASTKLTRIAAQARRLLATQAVCTAVIATLVALVAAGWVDFLLRLPGTLRLVLGLSALGVGVWWLAREARAVAAFHPTPAQLALRCERLDPRLAGRLASAVELGGRQPIFGESTDMTALSVAMAAMSQRQVRQMLDRAALPRLLDPGRTLRLAALAALTIVASLIVAAAAGQATGIALRRWLLPLGDTHWPRRVQLVDLGQRAVWPSDAPLRLRAAVTRGARPNLRAWVWRRYVVDGRAQPWQRQLMVRQDPIPAAAAQRDQTAVYEAVLEPLEAPARRGPGHDTPPRHEVEYRFEAADDRTPVRRVTVADRPRLVAFTAQIMPPPYAAEQIEPRSIAWDGAAPAADEALVGSRVILTVSSSRPLAADGPLWAYVVPGLSAAMHGELPQVRTAGEGSELTIAFTLAADLHSAIRLRDDLGLTDQTDAVFHLRARDDRLPTVTLDAPTGPMTPVTPGALVTLEATARDDVALAAMALRAQRPPTSDETLSAVEAPPAAGDRGPPLSLDETAGPRRSLTYELDLAAFAPGAAALRPGDQLLVFAEARDNFELNGQGHPWVQSPARVLQIVEPAVVAGRLRRELAVMRRAILQMQDRQATLARSDDAPASLAQQTDQARLTQQVLRQLQQAEDLQRQAARNRLDDALLMRVLTQAHSLLTDAAQAADRGSTEPTPIARQAARRQAAEKLGQLAAILDQGHDVLALQGELEALQRRQRQITSRTADLQSRTLGLDPQALEARDPDAAAALERLRTQQADAGEEAQRLTDRLHAAAEALARQGGSAADQAAAATLADAAATARREGLTMQMRQAAAQMGENRLAGAGQQQQTAERIMTRMLEAIGRQEQRRQEILARLLDDLKQAVDRLVAQQRTSLQQVSRAVKLDELVEPLALLRRNTQVVSGQAAEEAPQAEAHLRAAGEHQGQAVDALRGEQRTDAQAAQQAALAALERAAATLDEQRRQADNQQERRQRQALATRYRELATRQSVVREQTAGQAGRIDTEGLTRATRRALLELSRTQQAIRDEAAELRGQVNDAPLFEHLHEQVDDQAAAAAARLRTGEASSQVMRQQTEVADSLTTMADALVQTADMAYQRPLSGEGAGSGAGAGPTPDPARLLAELKLLRHLQQQIYDHGASQTDNAKIENLARRQEQVVQLGADLARRLAATQQNMDAPAPERHQ